jgi:hypothetical protein
MYFFAGAMTISWCIWIIGLLNLADKFVFQILLTTIWLCGGFLLFLRRRFFYSLMKKGFNACLHVPLFARGYALVLASVLVSYTLISLAVPTDADSLSYHLALPVEILEKGSLWFNKDNLHFRMAGFGEMLNLLGVANGCPQLGSFIQVIALLHVLYALTRVAEPGLSVVTLCMILSIPTLLFLVPGQKHQLTGILATTLCFVQLHRHRSLGSGESTLWILVLLFAVGLKYSFVLSAGTLVLLFIVKCRTRTELSRFVWMLVFLGGLVLGPQFLFRWYHFGDPLSPLLERFVAQQDPIVLKLFSYIKSYRESSYIFPVNLLFPASIGRISTIVGLSAVALFSVPFLYKSYKNEVIAILFLLVLILAGGQATSRFLMEPVFWSIPLFIAGFHTYRWFRYVIVLSKLSLILLLPFLFFGLYSLGPSLFSDQQREEVLLESANGYAESKWLDEVLPLNAKIASSAKFRAFLPRPYLPWEYLLFTSLKDAKQAAVLDQQIKDYKINYLVLPYRGMDELKERYGAELVRGPQKFNSARRNPFNKSVYEIAVYKVRGR